MTVILYSYIMTLWISACKQTLPSSINDNNVVILTESQKLMPQPSEAIGLDDIRFKTILF